MYLVPVMVDCRGINSAGTGWDDKAPYSQDYCRKSAIKALGYH